MLVQRYYAAANTIDVANQYRQGMLAIERTWATHKWETRLFQTFMGISLCNAFYAYKHFEDRRITLQDFTNLVVQGLVDAAKETDVAMAEAVTEEAVGERLRQRKSSERAVDVLSDPCIDHALYSCQEYNVGTGTKHAGRCRVCGSQNAHHYCQTCSPDVTQRGGIFYICAPGAHGRHCYAKHMHVVLKGLK